MTLVSNGRKLTALRSAAVLVILAIAAPVLAAPAADLVVVWAPGARIAPIEAVARRSGAAVIDRSPAPPGAATTAKSVHAGIAQYNALSFDAAARTLDAAAREADQSGAAGLTPAELSDLFLYRGLVKNQLGDESGGWDDLVIASAVDPTRDLDPLVFPPKVVEEFGRARETVGKRDRARLSVQAPAGCAATVDGAPAVGEVERVVGLHWVRVTCADRAPQGMKVELTAGATTLPIQPAPYEPPTDSELHVQARTASARAFIAVEVHGAIGTARLVGVDGRERDRRTVTITGDLAPLADAVGALLQPAPRTHWYQSRWALAGGVAVLAAAVLVPITAAIAGAHSPASWTARPQLPPGASW